MNYDNSTLFWFNHWLFEALDETNNNPSSASWYELLMKNNPLAVFPANPTRFFYHEDAIWNNNPVYAKQSVSMSF